MSFCIFNKQLHQADRRQNTATSPMLQRYQQLFMRLRKLYIILLVAVTFLSCKQSEESLFNQAVALDKSVKYLDAIETYSLVIKGNAKNEMALYKRALCWYELDSN